MIVSAGDTSAKQSTAGSVSITSGQTRGTEIEATSGKISLLTGVAAARKSSSGGVRMGSGDATLASGGIEIYSGTATAGASGAVALRSGKAKEGVSGSVAIEAGSSTESAAGLISVVGGSGATTGSSISLVTGEGGVASGGISIATHPGAQAWPAGSTETASGQIRPKEDS